MDIKRGLHYLPHMLFTTVIFVVAGIILISNSEEMIYGKANFDQINVCYYMPNDSFYNQMAAGIVENTDSVKDTLNLFAVESIEKGYELIENNEVYCFVIIPESFINSVMTGENKPIELIYKGNGSFEEFAVNDLFVNFGGYLGTAQAISHSIYSMADKLGLEHSAMYGYSEEYDINNMKFVINREAMFKDSEFLSSSTNDNTTTIVASVILIIAIMSGFILSRFFLRPTNAYYMKQLMSGQKKYMVYLSQILSGTLLLFIVTTPTIFIFYFIIPGVNLLSVIFMPVITFIISLYMACVSWIFKNESQASLFIVLIFILLLYLAGGIMPLAFMPHIIQQLAVINPVYWLNRLCGLFIF